MALPTLPRLLSNFAHLLQSTFFPAVEEEIGELSELAKRLTIILNLIPLSRFIPVSRGWNGRPSLDRVAIASAFVAKAVYNFPTTRHLLDRLHSDPNCGRSVAGIARVMCRMSPLSHGPSPNSR